MSYSRMSFYKLLDKFRVGAGDGEELPVPRSHLYFSNGEFF